MKQELIISYDKNTGESLEYWPKQDGIKKKKHGFHILDKNNSEITQIWLDDKQSKSLAFGILNSIYKSIEEKEGE